MKEKLVSLASSSPFFAMGAARLRAIVYALLSLPKRLFRFRTVFIGSNVKMIGIGRIKICKNTAIGSGSWLNVNNTKAEGTALHIGENCFIGQDNFFTVGEKIVVRDYCLTTKGCAFIGSAHIYSDPFFPYAATGTKDSGIIYIGVNCFFGLASRIVGNVVVGHGSVVGAGAEVREDVPPYSLVVGSPARIIKRFDFRQMNWIKWPTEEYNEGPSEEIYLKKLQSNKRWLLHYISAAENGVYDLP